MNDKMEALETASEYIKRLKAGVKTAAEYFESFQEARGTDLIYQISDGISWLMDVLVLTVDIQKEKIELESLTSKIKEIVQAISSENYVLLADLLEYELIPIFSEMERKIQLSLK